MSRTTRIEWLREAVGAIAQLSGFNWARYPLRRIITDPIERQNAAKALLHRDALSQRRPRSLGGYLHAAASVDGETPVVRFQGRENERDDLTDWCIDDAHQPLPWRIVTGAGGRGKTRLARELVARLNGMADRPITAGFLNMDAVAKAPETLDYFAEVPGDLVLVVDYAERHRETLAAVLRASLHLAEADRARRVRVLMLTRGPSDLWQKLATDDELIAEFMGDAPPYWPLDPLGPDEETRRRLFDAAYADFVASFPATPGSIYPNEPVRANVPAEGAAAVPNLDGEMFADVLMIHMAALASAQGATAAETGSPDRLLGWIRDREQRNWNQVLRQRSDLSALQDDPVHQGAIVLTLAASPEGVPDRDTTRGYLAAAPLLADRTSAELDALAKMFEVLYPAAGSTSGITPDRLAAYVLLDAKPGTLRAAVDRLPAEALFNGLIKLNWAAQGWEATGWANLRTALAADPRKTLPLAVRAAVASGDPIGRIAAEVFDPAAHHDLAASLNETIPHTTTALRELAATVTDCLYRNQPTGTTEDRADKARLASNLSVRLSDLGRREDGLETAREAVDTYRQLARERPDAFTHALAQSLNNLAKMLSDLGHREAALKTAQETVEIRRQLARKRPDTFTPDLGAALNNLARSLGDLRHREQAAETAREAVDTYRQLTREGPDAFIPDLARSLNNLATMLRDLGRREAALDTAREAVDTYRKLARERPDAFTPELARSLKNLATMLSDLGRREAALETVREAVNIYRQLKRERANAFTPELAMSLNNLAAMLSHLERREEALDTAREAVDSYRKLARERPDTFTPDLGRSLKNAAAILSNLGRHEGALDTAREAVDIYQQLARERPDAFTPELAVSLGSLGQIQDGLGHLRDAHAAIHEAITLLGPVFRTYPDAYVEWMRAMCSQYLDRAERLGGDPDAELLQPIVDILQSRDAGESGAAGDDAARE